jgi:Phage terminase large subunit (GpA)
MTAETKYLKGFRDSLFEVPTDEQPDEWAEKNLILDEEQVKGPFTFKGRNYLRKPIRDNNNPNVREQTVISGTGAGKTISYIVGILWMILFKPFRGLFIMPATNGEGGARNFSGTRVLPDIDATPQLSALIPAGQSRFKMNKQFIRLNGSHVGFVGANSPGQLGANRCSRVWMDEVDKFKGRLGNEAGTNALARNRVKGVKDYQIFDTSTPTIETGVIWPRMQRSNIHLYFVPCPHCNGGRHGKTEEEREIELKAKKAKGWMVYCWNRQFSAGLPNRIVTKSFQYNIPFAEVAWNQKAKGKDGIWDYQQVLETAHFVCPHCKGEIFDSKVIKGKYTIDPDIKEWMDENGVWIKVKEGVPMHIGYHFSSLYAPVINSESTLGGLAVQFLAAIESGGEEVRDFINSVLALPEAGQQFDSGVSIEVGKGISGEDGITWDVGMGVDRQEKYPGFWFVVRRWVINSLLPLRDQEKQSAFMNQLSSDELRLCARIAHPEMLAQFQRCQHWREICGWLVSQNIKGLKLDEFLKGEFRNDFMRLLDFICKQESVKVRLIKPGDSEALEVGSADSWEELDEIQFRHNIANHDIIVDARYGQMDNAEVFAECFRRCPKDGFCFYSPVQTAMGMARKFSQLPFPGARPFALRGWTPCMGFPENKRWASKDKIRLPYGQAVNDPFSGKAEARQFFQYVFQFDASWSLSELQRIRKKYIWELNPKVVFSGNNAQMNPVSIKDYNLHMKGYFWNETEMIWDSLAKRGGSQSRLHPNHLYDCEKNLAARAVWKGIFKYGRDKE